MRFPSRELILLARKLAKDGTFRKPKDWESLTCEANKFHLSLNSEQIRGERRFYFADKPHYSANIITVQEFLKIYDKEQS